MNKKHQPWPWEITADKRGIKQCTCMVCAHQRHLLSGGEPEDNIYRNTIVDDERGLEFVGADGEIVRDGDAKRYTRGEMEAYWATIYAEHSAIVKTYRGTYRQAVVTSARTPRFSDTYLISVGRTHDELKESDPSLVR